MKQQRFLSKLILIAFLIIIILQFSLAQTTITPTAPTDSTSTETNDEVQDEEEGPNLPTKPLSEKSKIPTTPEEILSEAERTAQEGLARESEISEVESIILPTILQEPTKFIFGIKDDNEVSLEKLIVLVSLFILWALFIYSILSTIAPFSNYISWIISILFPIAFGMFGITNQISDYIFSSITLFNISTLVIIIIAMVVFLIFSKGARERLKSLRVSKAQKKGQRFAENREYINTLGESLRNI